MLTADRVQNQVIERTDNFREDPSVKTGSASLEDYQGSGYDRGHLAPAADMRWSKDAMNDCFYLSNMSPQNASFNRGIWSRVEAMVRDWAITNDTEYVVTGPVLTDSLESIGPNNVSVPKLFYKVVLVRSHDQEKAIGLLLKNDGSKEPLQSFAVTVDSVEKVTGIDFYPTLPDSIENRIEGHIDLTQWAFPSPNNQPILHKN